MTLDQSERRPVQARSLAQDFQGPAAASPTSRRDPAVTPGTLSGDEREVLLELAPALRRAVQLDAACLVRLRRACEW